MLDRMGGADGYDKAWRRYGIPLVLFLYSMSVEQAILSVLLAVIFTFNLDEIEEVNYEEIFLHGLGVSYCLFNVAGWFGAVVAVWWTVGTALSNFGIDNRYTLALWDSFRRWRLDWKWVEIGRGACMGLAICLNQLLG